MKLKSPAPPAQLALVEEPYWVWVAICAIKGTESLEVQEGRTDLFSSGDC